MATAHQSNPKGCLGNLLQLLLGGSKVDGQRGEDVNLERLPYRTRDDFLSPAERSFYRVLTLVVGGHAVICPKVNLSDVLYVIQPNQNIGFVNKIKQKHVDFILCEPATMRILAGIELDDSSHMREDRRHRDALVANAFEVAGLPLIQFTAQAAYNAEEMRVRLTPVLTPDGQTGSTAVQEHAVSETPLEEQQNPKDRSQPTCPKCAGEMVRRKSARGLYSGREFWGCVNFPRCRQIIPIDD